jgi:hypothetical protein
MPEKQITYDEYRKALEEKIRLEKYLEHLTRITRAYIYQEEGERVKARKKQTLIDNNLNN